MNDRHQSTSICPEVGTAVCLARELKPDIVIMDLMMPVMSGAEATRIIREENPDIRIVILTTFGSSADLALAVRYGASATLLKDTETADLVNVLCQVHAGKCVIPATIRASANTNSTIMELTERQQTIRHTHIPSAARRCSSSASPVEFRTICQPLTY